MIKKKKKRQGRQFTKEYSEVYVSKGRLRVGLPLGSVGPSCPSEPPCICKGGTWWRCSLLGPPQLSEPLPRGAGLPEARIFPGLVCGFPCWKTLNDRGSPCAEMAVCRAGRTGVERGGGRPEHGQELAGLGAHEALWSQWSACCTHGMLGLAESSGSGWLEMPCVQGPWSQV